MRELGPHRYGTGDVIGRWRVVRASSPVPRAHGGGRMVVRHRVLVECACGRQRIVLERLLAKGESTGCRSKVCQSMYALRLEAGALRREGDVLSSQTRARLDEVEAKLERLQHRMPFRGF